MFKYFFLFVLQRAEHATAPFKSDPAYYYISAPDLWREERLDNAIYYTIILHYTIYIKFAKYKHNKDNIDNC